jgi:hypothetical protein
VERSGAHTGLPDVHIQVYLMCSNSRELVKKIVFVFQVRCFPGHSLSRLRVLVSGDVGRQAGSAVRQINCVVAEAVLRAV